MCLCQVIITKGQNQRSKNKSNSDPRRDANGANRPHLPYKQTEFPESLPKSPRTGGGKIYRDNTLSANLTSAPTFSKTAAVLDESPNIRTYKDLSHEEKNKQKVQRQKANGMNYEGRDAYFISQRTIHEEEIVTAHTLQLNDRSATSSILGGNSPRRRKQKRPPGVSGGASGTHQGVAGTKQHTSGRGKVMIPAQGGEKKYYQSIDSQHSPTYTSVRKDHTIQASGRSPRAGEVGKVDNNGEGMWVYAEPQSAPNIPTRSLLSSRQLALQSIANNGTTNSNTQKASEPPKNSESQTLNFKEPSGAESKEVIPVLQTSKMATKTPEKPEKKKLLAAGVLTNIKTPGRKVLSPRTVKVLSRFADTPPLTLSTPNTQTTAAVAAAPAMVGFFSLPSSSNTSHSPPEVDGALAAVSGSNNLTDARHGGPLSRPQFDLSTRYVAAESIPLSNTLCRGRSQGYNTLMSLFSTTTYTKPRRTPRTTRRPPRAHVALPTSSSATARVSTATSTLPANANKGNAENHTSPKADTEKPHRDDTTDRGFLKEPATSRARQPAERRSSVFLSHTWSARHVPPGQRGTEHHAEHKHIKAQLSALSARTLRDRRMSQEFKPVFSETLYKHGSVLQKMMVDPRIPFDWSPYIAEV